jgi:hypothetical protein
MGSAKGWNQCVVSTELKVAVAFPQQQQRQFLELDVGFSSSGSFMGVSGQNTNQLWDNPRLRNWIWTDPNSQGNFILSTGASVASTTSTTSSTSTTLRTTSSTTSTSTSLSSITTTTSWNALASFNLATHVACPSGIQYCGNASPVGSGSYPGGSTVTLTAYPYGGFVLSSWSICTNTCKTYSDNPLSLVLTSDTQATANFVRG